MNLYDFKMKHGDPVVGTEVAVGGRNGFTFGKIVKFTPSGQFTVENTHGYLYRFTNEGRAHGHSGWLEFDVEAAKRQETLQAAKQKAIIAINKLNTIGLVRSKYASKKGMDDLLKQFEEAVAVARAAVDMIPSDPNEDA